MNFIKIYVNIADLNASIFSGYRISQILRLFAAGFQ